MIRVILSTFLFLTALPLPLWPQPKVTFNLEHPPAVYPLTVVKVSPDGLLVASGDTQGTVKLWRLKSVMDTLAQLKRPPLEHEPCLPLKLLRDLRGHSGSVSGLAFSLDGREVYSSSADGTLCRWASLTGKLLTVRNPGVGPLTVLAASGDGTRIALGSATGAVVVGNPRESGDFRLLRPRGPGVLSLSWSPGGDQILCGFSERDPEVWNVADGTMISMLRLPEGAGGLTAWSPVAPLAVTDLRNSGDLVLWDTGTWFPVRKFSTGSSQAAPVRSLTYNSQGSLIACGTDRGVAVVDIRKNYEPRRMKYSYQKAFGYANDFSPGERFIVSSFPWSPAVCDMSTGNLLAASPPMVSARKNSLALAADPSLLRYSTPPYRLVDWKSGTVVRNSTPAPFAWGEISPDGEVVLQPYGMSSTLYIHDMAGGEALLERPYHGMEVTTTAWTPDSGSFFLGRSDGAFSLHQRTGGGLIRKFLSSGGPVNRLSVSPGGEDILVGTGGGFAEVWSIKTGVRKWVLSRPGESFTAAVWDAAGKRVALGTSGGTAMVCQESDGIPLWESQAHKGEISTLAFTPDGTELISGGYDAQLVRLRAKDGTPGGTLRGHASIVTDCVVTPEGTRLFSRGNDGLRVWDMASGKEILCLVTRVFGKEWFMVTPDGLFGGDDEKVDEYLYIVDGLDIFPLGALFEKNYQPEIILGRLTGRLPLPEQVTDLTFDPPPAVTLEVERTDGTYRGLGMDALSLPYRVSGGKVRLRTSVRDRGGGAASLRLYVNGKLVEVKDSNEGPLEGHLVTLTLAPGRNIIKAVAYTRRMTESEPVQVTVDYESPSPQKPDLYILSLGVDSYKNPGMNLGFAVSDARSFVSALTLRSGSLYRRIVPWELINSEATADRFREALERIAGQARPEDVFVFFYSGHGLALEKELGGTGDFSFVLWDVVQPSDQNLLGAKGLSAREFQEYSRRIAAQKQLLIIDACHSGALERPFLAKGDEEDRVLARLSRSTGTVLIAASQEWQVASEFSALGHGALTQALLEGLEGGGLSGEARVITALALRLYVEEAVPRITEKYLGTPQFPKGFSFGQDFPLAIKEP